MESPAPSSASISPENVKSILEVHIENCVQQMRKELPEKPWGMTISFVSLDLPKSSSDMVQWIELLVVQEEAGEGCKRQILERFPTMREKAETDVFMTELILPFRSFFVMQVVMDIIRKQRQADAKDPERSGGPRLGPTPELMPSYEHAAHHAQDVEDVFFIDSLVPNGPAKLEQHIHRMKTLNVCTRYAEYRLELSRLVRRGEEAGDEEWAARLLPFAEGGLAMAQYDVGMCLLGMTGHDPEGLAWLERAAQIGHTGAMLELAKFSLQQAMQIPNRGGPLRAYAASVQRLPAEPVPDLVKKSLKWLDILSDTSWDKNTPADQQQGRNLLNTIETDAKKFLDHRLVADRLKKQRQKKWRTMMVLAVIAVAIAFVATLALWINSLERDMDPPMHEEPTHAVPHFTVQ
jgi:hypothetical protein